MLDESLLLQNWVIENKFLFRCTQSIDKSDNEHFNFTSTFYIYLNIVTPSTKKYQNA